MCTETVLLLYNEPNRFAEQGLRVEIARTARAVREAQALRHRVFCQERHIFQVEFGRTTESDEFDPRAVHVLIRDEEDDEVVATSRVVTASSEPGALCLPMQRYCSPSLFRDLPMASVGEISRFAISKHARSRSGAAGPLLRLGLLQGILHVSLEMGLTHWCALMERSLIRLLGATGVHFEPLAPMVEACGLRQPSVATISHALAHGRWQKPEYYRLVSSPLLDDVPMRERPSPGRRSHPAVM